MLLRQKWKIPKPSNPGFRQQKPQVLGVDNRPIRGACLAMSSHATQPSNLGWAGVADSDCLLTAIKLLLHANNYDVDVTSVGRFRVIDGRD